MLETIRAESRVSKSILIAKLIVALSLPLAVGYELASTLLVNPLPNGVPEWGSIVTPMVALWAGIVSTSLISSIERDRQLERITTELNDLHKYAGQLLARADRLDNPASSDKQLT